MVYGSFVKRILLMMEELDCKYNVLLIKPKKILLFAYFCRRN